MIRDGSTMIKTFRRKTTFVDRVAEALGRKPKHSGPTMRSGLVTLGSVAGVAAASAVVSAIRARQDQGDQDDRE
jgi:hypothetical protein